MHSTAYIRPISGVANLCTSAYRENNQLFITHNYYSLDFSSKLTITIFLTSISPKSVMPTTRLFPGILTYFSCPLQRGKSIFVAAS